MVVGKALALREADPGAAMDRFFESFEARSRIESELLEDQAIDYLLSRMRDERKASRLRQIHGRRERTSRLTPFWRAADHSVTARKQVQFLRAIEMLQLRYARDSDAAQQG